MKKIIKVTAVISGFLFLLGTVGSPLSAQLPQKATGDTNPIPPEVMKILQKSCAKCHIDGQAAGLKFTEWNTYSPEKQASRAKAMCNEVTKGFMPPRNFQKKNPDAVPTQADIKTICDWSTKLQPPKK
jgi:hypothetical protein